MNILARKDNYSSEKKDEQRNLINVQHYALEGVAIYEQYIKDARKTNDRELITFFQELREFNLHAAKKAERLLKERFN